ncbi:DUF6538 domain-containing protein [Ruegeria profundi]|uniref:DUF6538 domain-containing protein n=1 Tax=Ruegeria profundi TaxID=1685378 RepID=UPI003850A5F8
MDARAPKGLFKRGKGYALRVAVPAEYQAIIGKKEIVRGLGTQDLSEALVKRKEVLTQIVSELSEGNRRASLSAFFAVVPMLSCVLLARP